MPYHMLFPTKGFPSCTGTIPSVHRDYPVHDGMGMPARTAEVLTNLFKNTADRPAERS